MFKPKLMLSSPLWHVAHKENKNFVQNGRWSPQKENTFGQSKSMCTVGTASTETGQAGVSCNTPLSMWTRGGSCEHDREYFGSVKVAYP
jgi:hypothetical protein